MTCGGCGRCKMPDAAGTQTVIVTVRVMPGDAITPRMAGKLASKAADAIHDTLADEAAEITHTWAIYEGAEE